MDNAVSEQKSKKKLTKKDLRSVMWRHYQLLGSFNYERQMALGYAWSMTPVLKRLYGDDEEQLQKGYQRHLEFFNCSASVSPMILGISCAMEEQNANSEDFDASSINSVKSALMGPLAGIGDSMFWGTLRVIGVGIGAPLAIKGSILGPILYFLINVIPSELLRWFGFKLSYEGGNKFLAKASEDGTLEKLTEAAKILGLVVIGAMIASMVIIKVPMVLKFGGTKIKVQETLDSLLPDLLPLLLTFGCYGLLQKKVNGTVILIGLIILGILAVAVGLL
ncbi:PTS system mannose/fructose/sorbose family transporter subunit IID [Lactobacillus sp. ESL0681]|uniref:PTS system mannose/fructose/sorbose family transporter subunit IID n=1 Tax=Lactobacillus sp. ESL0681 TaxID=2983211 RepID=UPI0023F95A20|nr:PTS system mannose/fructose/sorbose family transporter subunit IID [Lactobacillus sp. ESL0681]WEV40153.1 PTS system mannose/fructose/sorbose family transporter subunit IID [Lactobacillus sp. ESL0681]